MFNKFNNMSWEEDGEIHLKNKSIDTLEKMGYYVRNLWRVEDVQSNYNLSDEDALELIDEVMTSEYIVSAIFELIDEKVKNYESKI